MVFNISQIDTMLAIDYSALPQEYNYNQIRHRVSDSNRTQYCTLRPPSSLTQTSASHSLYFQSSRKERAILTPSIATRCIFTATHRLILCARTTLVIFRSACAAVVPTAGCIISAITTLTVTANCTIGVTILWGNFTATELIIRARYIGVWTASHAFRMAASWPDITTAKRLFVLAIGSDRIAAGGVDRGT